MGALFDGLTGALSKAATTPGRVLGPGQNAQMVSFPLLPARVPGWREKYYTPLCGHQDNARLILRHPSASDMLVLWRADVQKRPERNTHGLSGGFRFVLDNRAG